MWSGWGNGRGSGWSKSERKICEIVSSHRNIMNMIILPKCSLNEVNKTMYFEVHVLVEGAELDTLEHVKQVQLANVHVHHILSRERDSYEIM